MSLLKRQLLSAVFFSLGLSILLLWLVFLCFPPEKWELLWQRQLLHMPFIAFVFAAALLAGLFVGLISYLFWRSLLVALKETLDDMALGTLPSGKNMLDIEEARPLLESVHILSEKLTRQTELAQKMAGDAAEKEEKVIQKVVSEERNRLARELHDSVSQQLFAASMLISAVTEQRAEATDTESRQLHLALQAVQQSQLEMRALFLHLRPVQLHGKTLEDGIQELLNELRLKVPMTIHWKVEPAVLDKGIEDQLFRILQESLSNVLRHSRAKSLTVLLIAPPGRVILRITDDGIGFDTQTNKPGAYGLSNMRERAEQIGGRLKLVSVKNEGTSLEVSVPLLEKGETNDDPHRSDR
ncbi:MAG: sensor histidine kinase [Sporolactobacillus sp.]